MELLSHYETMMRFLPRDKNGRNVAVYARTLAALCFTDPPEARCEKETTLAVIGDSHVLGAQGRQIQACRAEAHLLMGAKAWHFAQNPANMYKRRLHDILTALREGVDCLFSFGEIDCRLDEGVLLFSARSGVPAEDVARDTAQKMVAFVTAQARASGKRASFVTVPPPRLDVLSARQAGATPEALERLQSIIRCFNESLRLTAREEGAGLLDVYAFVGENSAGMWHMDSHHLVPEVWEKAVFCEKIG